MSRPFHFKQFSIYQENAAMKVGTDGVLLGAWASNISTQKILDIGCGTGLISLMLAQRFANSSIYAIDINKDALLDAKINIDSSKWSDRISLDEKDFLEIKDDRKFDLILTNPPFYEVDTRSPNLGRAVARSGADSTFLEWIKKAQNLLESNGSFAFIYPIDEWNKLEKELKSTQLYVNKLCKIRPTAEKSIHRIMVQLGFDETSYKEEKEFSIERSRHVYTEEYINLTRDFYLKMP